VGDGAEIEMIGILGFDEDTIKKWKRFPLEIKTPSTDCIRNLKPNILLSREEILNKYPHLEKEVNATGIYSMGSIPLIIGDSSIGSLSFNFCSEKTFSEQELKFMEALGGLCAQALYRSKLYDEARVAIQVRDEFLSIASHELKTPLTPLKLQLQLMARKIKNEPEKLKEGQLEKMINNADRQMNRLAKLIDDLLDVSRISAGKLKLHLEVVNLQDIIRDVLVQYSHELEANLGHVELEAPEPVYCNVDSLRIEQVLVNLLTNAVKYAPTKNIVVNLKKEENWARIRVKDQGPGIAQEDLERIFGRFERVRTTDNIGGLGLGLYISKQIIEAHMGKIYAESDDSGSTFIVELPLAQNV
jgi:signal transduction histidine kinase